LVASVGQPVEEDVVVIGEVRWQRERFGRRSACRCR
jgi:hypothetical protein